MKKILLVLFMIFTIGLFAEENIPKTEHYEIKERFYTVKIEYVKEYNQAVFIFITSEGLFREDNTAVILDDEIEKFAKEKGYLGWKGLQYEYRIRYTEGKVRYTKPVIFIMSSY